MIPALTRVAFVLAGACISPELLRAYQCQVYCKAGGWNDGTYMQGRCACIDYIEFNQIFETRLVWVNKAPAKKVDEPISTTWSYGPMLR